MVNYDVYRSECIRADTRRCATERRQQRRLAAVWRTDQTGIGDQLHLELDVHHLTGTTVLRRTSCAMSRSDAVRTVTFASFSTSIILHKNDNFSFSYC